MQIIKYQDPYADPRHSQAVDIVIEDDTPPECIAEVQKFLTEDCQRIWAESRMASRKQYSLEGRKFEGLDYAYLKTPEWIVIHDERWAELEEALSCLTETQARRFSMYWEDGLSIREIARIEEADYSSVLESIRAAKKKLSGLVSREPAPLPDYCPHYGKNHVYHNEENDG